MRRMTLAAICGALAFALPSFAAEQEPAAGPSVGHPLSALCDLICGGKWDPPNKPYPDEIRTTRSYRWDAQAGEIVGREVTSGGVRFVHVDVAVRYRVDADGEIEALRVTKDQPDAIAAVTLQDQSFVEVSPAVDGRITTRTYTFETPDEMIHTVEMTKPDTQPRSASKRFVRKW